MIIKDFNQVRYGDLIEVVENNGNYIFRGVAICIDYSMWMSTDNFRILPKTTGYTLDINTAHLPKYIDDNTGQVRHNLLPPERTPLQVAIGLVGETDFLNDDTKVEKIRSLYDTSSTVQNLIVNK